MRFALCLPTAGRGYANFFVKFWKLRYALCALRYAGF
jgi:hypothetical protein